MKAGWETKKFGEVLDIRNGRNQREVQSDTGQFPILGSAGKVMGYATDYLCEAGTTIIGRKGTINSPIYVETRFWNVDTAFGLAPKEALDPKFLHYFCLSYDFALLNCGTTIPSLVKTDLLKIEIPLPSREEQQRIVAVLDKAFAGIATAAANAQKVLTNARALFASYSANSLSCVSSDWTEVNLGQLCSFSQGKQIGLGEQITEPREGYVRFIRIIDYTQNTNDIRYVPDPGPKFHVGESDIVMVRYGTPGLIGRGIPGVIANNLFKIEITNKMISNDYLAMFLQQSSVQNFLSTRGSSTMPALNFGHVNGICISFPSPNEQSQIVFAVTALQTNILRLEAAIKSKIAALSELKQSLLQKAFAGELT